MVVPQDRIHLRNALARYMRGESDSDDLDNAVWKSFSKDESVRKIASALWGTYDDLARHRISVSREGWQFYKRCAAFLETDVEVAENRSDKSIWPFPSRLAIYQNRKRYSRPHFPRYDSAIHGRPFNSWNPVLTWGKLLIVLGIVLGIPVLIGWWSSR